MRPDWLPNGNMDERGFRQRHKVVVGVLFAHAPFLFLLGIFDGKDTLLSQATFQGYSVTHSLLEASVPALAGLVALYPRIPRRLQAGIAATGLALAAGIFTHLTGGFIEAHFHFFVMVALSAIYIDWIPFVLATFFVAVHHAVLGILDPGAVYNHPLALEFPVQWAIIHAFFILMQGAALIALMVLVQRAVDAERRRARTEEAAVADERAARRIADERARILAHVSHEVRTPLNAVLGLSKALAANATGEDARRLDIIHSSGRHVARMLDDILDQSQLEAAAVKLSPVPVRLGGLCRGIEDMMAPMAQEAGLDLEVIDHSDDAQVFLDVVRVEQILINLLSNAIKYTPEGRVALEAAVHGDDLVFTVSDTGVGMGAELLAHLFEPFRQGTTRSGNRGGGVGLGLAISHGLVRVMGGRIHVESQEGQGSTFTVTIPMTPVRLDDVAAQDLQGIKVLVVDDSEYNLEVARLLLSAQGATVAVALDGEAALSMLPGDFDAVLMDLRMPEMDGFQTVRRMRAARIQTPVIALTGVTDDDERGRARDAGFIDYVTKPLDARQVAAALHRALGGPVQALA